MYITPFGDAPLFDKMGFGGCGSVGFSEALSYYYQNEDVGLRNGVSSSTSQAQDDTSSWVTQAWNDFSSWVSNNWMSIIDWGANISSVAGSGYGIIQTILPSLGLPAVPVVGQVMFLAAGIWSIARLAGFGEE